MAVSLPIASCALMHARRVVYALAILWMPVTMLTEHICLSLVGYPRVPACGAGRGGVGNRINPAKAGPVRVISSRLCHRWNCAELKWQHSHLSVPLLPGLHYCRPRLPAQGSVLTLLTSKHA